LTAGAAERCMRASFTRLDSGRGCRPIALRRYSEVAVPGYASQSSAQIERYIDPDRSDPILIVDFAVSSGSSRTRQALADITPLPLALSVPLVDPLSAPHAAGDWSD
jgi:hypothetical protein